MQQVAVIKRLKLARQAALHADFARAEFPGFKGATLNFIEGMKVRIRLARRAAEGAEAATDEADVREVDVAVDDVSNHLADALAAYAVGGKHQGF